MEYDLKQIKKTLHPDEFKIQNDEEFKKWSEIYGNLIQTAEQIVAQYMHPKDDKVILQTDDVVNPEVLCDMSDVLDEIDNVILDYMHQKESPKLLGSRYWCEVSFNRHSSTPKDLKLFGIYLKQKKNPPLLNTADLLKMDWNFFAIKNKDKL